MGSSRLIFLDNVGNYKTGYNHLLLVVTLQMLHTYLGNIFHTSTVHRTILLSIQFPTRDMLGGIFAFSIFLLNPCDVY